MNKQELPLDGMEEYSCEDEHDKKDNRAYAQNTATRNSSIPPSTNRRHTCNTVDAVGCMDGIVSTESENIFNGNQEQTEVTENDISETTSEESLLECQDDHCSGLITGDEQIGKPSVPADYFCTSCDLLLCSTCQFTYHEDHELALITEARKAKEKYIDELLNGVNKSISKCQIQKLQLENLIEYMANDVKDLILKIESRAAKLCDDIQKRKQHLLDELRSLKKYNLSQYEGQLELVHTLKRELMDASDFGSTLLSHGEDSDVLTIGRDVSDNLHRLLKNRGLNGINVTSIKLDIPDQSQDEAHVDKMFGSLVQGIVRCGEAEQIASYNVDLPWPTGMAVTKTSNFVVTGKIGALDEKGKVMFFNKQGQLQNMDSLEDGTIPYGACIDHSSGDVLVTNSKNQIVKYSPQGKKKETVVGKFKGTGRATVMPHNSHLVVTSSEDHQVYLYDSKNRKYIIPTDDTQLQYPHYISTSEKGHVIVSDFQHNAVFVFDSGGKLLFKYLGNGAEGGQLKCPSAVCCDTFGNILVADFMNDRVHFVSGKGEFLGFLLTKENGITCPNFMTLDHENNLYVGQYGGEITVFRYLSFVKYI